MMTFLALSYIFKNRERGYVGPRHNHIWQLFGRDLCWKERAEGLKSFTNHVKQCTEIRLKHIVHLEKNISLENLICFDPNTGEVMNSKVVYNRFLQSCSGQKKFIAHTLWHLSFFLWYIRLHLDYRYFNPKYLKKKIKWFILKGQWQEKCCNIYIMFRWMSWVKELWLSRVYF